MEHLLLDWHIWHKAPEGVWQSLLMDLESLLSFENSYHKTNLHVFNNCGAIVKIVHASKVGCYLCMYSCSTYRKYYTVVK